MEHAIVHSDLERETIKPDRLVDQFLDHVLSYNRSRLPPEKLEGADCPACRSKTAGKTFSKLGLEYHLCDSCQTVYVSPRPSQNELRNYFIESPARKFWLNRIWEETADIRRSKILEPFLDWVEVFVGEYFSNDPVSIAEVYPTHWGLFEMWREKGWKGNYFLVEPYFAEALLPGNLTCSTLPFSTEKKFDGICLPDTLAWTSRPGAFFRWVSDHLQPRGLCFLTTILSSGFDVLMLKERASYFVPPERLNLFSFEALQNLVREFPVEVLECSTPGVLDIQNVFEAYRREEAAVPDFVKYLFKFRNSQALFDSFQEFLQSNRLSSQGRMVLQRK